MEGFTIKKVDYDDRTIAEREQEVIDRAWDEVKQDNFWNINITKVIETKAYQEYVKS